ncbi:unnamed protein product [Pseudo-nitzschia multistriata]|uniref:Uncharacterized protein n=1 Tax=Pseudo-nitzschia multistriata TaxID=183589 RepID=A0A448YVD5_9STRA|nr:unnamed protein product [Pseudo-nitzschia multistriata]
MFPKKIFSVIGLESSGTTFVSRMIARALGVELIEGSRPNRLALERTSDIQVQHFSLPWGAGCQKFPTQVIQNVVLPAECSVPLVYSTSSYTELKLECLKMAREAGIQVGYNRLIYPTRYLLDIVSSKEWYKSRGIDQIFIIVVRDHTVSQRARVKHCKNETLLKEEEKTGTDIITRAINKYILKSRRLSISSLDSLFGDISPKAMNATNDYHRGHEHRKLSLTAPLQGDNGVVLVSYESLNQLGDVYVKLLYETLGIESDTMPTIEDGNTKYIKNKSKLKDINRPKGSGYGAQAAREKDVLERYKKELEKRKRDREKKQISD